MNHEIRYGKSYAKINLSLDILGRRENGYHDLAMVMQTVSLCDEISISFQGERLSVSSNLSFLPTGEKNLAVKAAHLFYEALKEPAPPMHISMEKKIPVCAGLAGGSGNAAIVLKILNEHHETPFTVKDLCQIGEKVGSDVPYCIIGGTAFVEGTGELITPLSSLPPCYIILCKPNFPISTPDLFHTVDSIKIKHRPDTKGILQGMEEGDLTSIACRMFNVFEQALTSRQQFMIEEIKSVFTDKGALGASMSGSGPTVIGLFSQKEKATLAYDALIEDYPDTFFTTPV